MKSTVSTSFSANEVQYACSQHPTFIANSKVDLIRVVISCTVWGSLYVSSTIGGDGGRSGGGLRGSYLSC